MNGKESFGYIHNLLVCIAGYVATFWLVAIDGDLRWGVVTLLATTTLSVVLDIYKNTFKGE